MDWTGQETYVDYSHIMVLDKTLLKSFFDGKFFGEITQVILHHARRRIRKKLSLDNRDLSSIKSLLKQTAEFLE